MTAIISLKDLEDLVESMLVTNSVASCSVHIHSDTQASWSVRVELVIEIEHLDIHVHVALYYTEHTRDQKTAPEAPWGKTYDTHTYIIYIYIHVAGHSPHPCEASSGSPQLAHA